MVKMEISKPRWTNKASKTAAIKILCTATRRIERRMT